MSRSDDGRPINGRRDLTRIALIWIPIFIVFSAIAVNFLVCAADGNGGAWVLFVLTALVSLLSGYSALAVLRDLFADPVETEGPIRRKWTKTDLFLFRGRHLLVQKRVFRLRRDIYSAMPEEGARIYLLHYPHTNALIAWEEIKDLAPLESLLPLEHYTPATIPPAQETTSSPHSDPSGDDSTDYS